MRPIHEYLWILGAVSPETAVSTVDVRHAVLDDTPRNRWKEITVSLLLTDSDKVKRCDIKIACVEDANGWYCPKSS